MVRLEISATRGCDATSFISISTIGFLENRIGQKALILCSQNSLFGRWGGNPVAVTHSCENGHVTRPKFEFLMRQSQVAVKITLEDKLQTIVKYGDSNFRFPL